MGDPMDQQRDIDEADRMTRLTLADALADGEEHGYHRGVRDERARIRRELLEAIDGDGWVERYEVRRALDRICPEED